MLPNLSQLQAWDTEHLIDAAHYWSRTADLWEDVFLQMRNQSHTIVWDGAGGEALRARTGGDLVIVTARADQLRQAAVIAREGAGTIGAAQRRVIYAVQDANDAGFNVGEDLSVVDTRTSRTAAEQASRQAQAQAFAADIRQRATQLIGAEHEAGAKVTAATAGIATTSFPETPHDHKPRIQAVDQRIPVPQGPPPPPYPVNEVIAEATDLDGNHVILRRGYYDATTKQGFGWDKAYWRHGVINPNVFKDLISHSRPISDAGGTLVYEVPINRTHCTSGLFGLPSCQDTGESLTMRIVANINQGNPTVPGGGQKGVITMYPLAGGSGVVEIGPNWTWTPPWVNNYVPIN
ncbi:MAG: hypothetical protein K2X56_04665 [Mycobacterium pseudokansasii]|uniref:hypothetical protein n=1 Tax=Mycobacterium pseudokansasii TaxID=2341080 RepID=UPI0023F02404|nr:hypothetical protein [Mycobacterium pseudokansasii]MBY0387402.1 hypothetical protein [Mycobacterium pseudokansasii]